jgi:hypothetical protein
MRHGEESFGVTGHSFPPQRPDGEEATSAGFFNVLGEVRVCYHTCFQALLQEVLGHLPALWKMCPTHRCCLVGVRRSVLDAVGTGMPPLASSA